MNGQNGCVFEDLLNFYIMSQDALVQKEHTTASAYIDAKNYL